MNCLKLFYESPVIYSILILMGLVTFLIWLQTFLTLKISELVPSHFIHKVKKQLQMQAFEDALKTCKQEKSLSAKVIACGIATRHLGTQVMMDAMQAEGRRCGSALWKRIDLLKKIATLAPILGILGSVISMLYTVHKINKTEKSLSTIFNEFGLSMGSTLCGFCVATLALICYQILKSRLSKLLQSFQNETFSLGSLIESPSES